MVLVTHQFQGSNVTCPWRPLSWSKGLTLKRYVTTVHMVARRERCCSLKRNLSLSIGASSGRGLRVKHLKISAFKGSAQNDESGCRANGSKIHKNSVKLSYVPKEREETLAEPPKAHNVPLSYTSESNENTAGSAAIQRLFKKWLKMLRTQSPSQVVDEVLEEGSPTSENSAADHEPQSKEQAGILKVVLHHFWGLDASIKLPLLIFVPWFLAVNVMYGAEVSKELTPLWVCGPFVLALYIKFLRGLFALYVYTFKQTVKIITNLPSYYLVAYNYVAEGKLTEDTRRVWQPVQDIKNMDYKVFSKRMLKVLQEWLVEKYLDFVESIWPYYCRTIRFLKRANLI